MLPFDNKSEFQVMLDEMAEHLATVPEVSANQVYLGTAAPISFNGLVRQYYLREGGTMETTHQTGLTKGA